MGFPDFFSRIYAPAIETGNLTLTLTHYLYTTRIDAGDFHSIVVVRLGNAARDVTISSRKRTQLKQSVSVLTYVVDIFVPLLRCFPVYTG